MVVFAIHRHESAMGAHALPDPEPPSHLPPHPIPLGCPRALALGALFHVLVICFSYGNIHVLLCSLTQSKSLSLHLCKSNNFCSQMKSNNLLQAWPVSRKGLSSFTDRIKCFALTQHHT